MAFSVACGILESPEQRKCFVVPASRRKDASERRLRLL